MENKIFVRNRPNCNQEIIHKNKSSMNRAKRSTEDDLEEIEIELMYNLYLKKELIFLQKYENKFIDYCIKFNIIKEKIEGEF